jgi:hypothetical protein
MTERTEGKESRVEGLPVEPGRRGIALVIVLGLLSVMMIMGVAFSISMRTERTAAGHQMEVVKARQLVYGALAHALWDIEDDLKRNTNAVYPRHWAREPMPTWFSNAVDLYAGDAVRLLPRGLLETCGQLASPGSNSWVGGDKIWDRNAFWRNHDLLAVGAVVEGPDAGGVVQRGNVLDNTLRTIDADVGSWGRRWYRIVDPAVPQWTPVKDVGRYAYLVVNLSGLLDANRAGGAPRGIGATPGELTLDNLPEMLNVTDFTNRRALFSMDYETIADMLANNIYISTNIENLFTYSRYGPYSWDTATGAVRTSVFSLDKSETMSVPRWTKLVSELRRVGDLTGLEAMYAAWNIVDFADDDRVPGNLGGLQSAKVNMPSVEAFPMLNEAWAEADVTIEASTNIIGTFDCRVRYAPEYEIIYPFISPSLPPGRYVVTHTFTAGAANDIPGLAGWPAPATYTINSVLANRHLRVRALTPLPFFNVTAKDQPLTLGGPLRLDLAVDLSIEDLDEGVAVDVVSGLQLQLEIDLPAVILSYTDDTGGGKECIDPRRNYDMDEWLSVTNHSMATTNAATLAWFAANPGSDGDLWMYVKDAPYESVGELGAIYYGRTWETFRLYDHVPGDHHDILDRFSVNADPSLPSRALVNLNTEVTQALEAVYWDMPLREYTNTPLFAAADVAGVVDLIMNSGFTNRSDMGRIDWANAFNWAALQSALAGLDPAEITELDREAIIRNSCELVGVRQNLFAILLAAQTALTPEEYGPIRAEQQALAIVWRDPYPDASGRHPCFVRWFTWLGQ